jgi:hypothetical protein
VGGGWCMNDEAAAHYRDIIDQGPILYNFTASKNIDQGTMLNFKLFLPEKNIGKIMGDTASF